MKKTIIALIALTGVASADMVIFDITGGTPTYGTYEDITFVSSGAITEDIGSMTGKTATLNDSTITITAGTGTGTGRGMLGDGAKWTGSIPVDLGISANDIATLSSSAAYIAGTNNQYSGVITLTVSGLSQGYYNLSALAAKGTGDTSNITMNVYVNGVEWTGYSKNATYYTYSSGSWGTATQGKPTFSAVANNTPSGAYADFEYIYVDEDASTIKLTLTGSSENGTKNLKALQFVAIESVPEPTTATLSLLALAGLAARRRRR